MTTEETIRDFVGTETKHGCKPAIVGLFGIILNGIIAGIIAGFVVFWLASLGAAKLTDGGQETKMKTKNNFPPGASATTKIENGN